MASITASRVPAAAAQNGAVATHPYTCNTCQVAFRNSDLQRGHMRTDWHRYNLKRRVTSLPPISSEVFTEKVLQAQASTSAAANKAAYERTCTLCARTYFSENAYQNHIGSQKHKAKLANAGQRGVVDDDASSVMSSTFSLGEPTTTKHAELDSDEDEMDEVVQGISKANLKDASNNTKRPAGSQADLDETETVKTASSVSAKPEELTKQAALKRCLFCNFDSPSIESNTSHMERMHGMFIPERDYLVDLEGLIGSLFEKIYEYQECLYCGKLKSSIFGLQTHMRDKGHCKIPFHTEDEQLEIGDFYDFRSTYSDGEDDESGSESELPGKQRSGGAKLGAKRVAKDEDEEMVDGEGWETDSSESTVDSDDIGSIPIEDKPRTRTNGTHKHTATVYHTDYELHLPSGRTAGHRSMNKYYRQNLHNYPNEEERAHQLAIEAAKGSDDSSSEEEVDQRVARRNERERGRALASRANGGRGMLGVAAEKRKEVLAEEKRSRKTAERARRQYEWGNNKQANSQKHFRDPLLQ